MCVKVVAGVTTNRSEASPIGNGPDFDLSPTRLRLVDGARWEEFRDYGNGALDVARRSESPGVAPNIEPFSNRPLSRLATEK
jgi:hypothetical protein